MSPTIVSEKELPEISQNSHTGLDVVTQDMAKLTEGKYLNIPAWVGSNDLIIMDVFPTSGTAGLPEGAPAVTDNFMQRIAWHYTGIIEDLGAGFEGVIKWVKLGSEREYVINNASEIINKLADQKNYVEENSTSTWDGAESDFSYLPLGSGFKTDDWNVNVKFSPDSTGTVKIRFSNFGTDGEENFRTVDGAEFNHTLNGGGTLQIGNHYGAGRFVGTVTVICKRPDYNATTDVLQTDFHTYTKGSDEWESEVGNLPILPFVNTAPIASITCPRFAKEEILYSLSSSTADIDYDTLTFKWVQTSGIPVSIEDDTAQNTTFTTPSVSGDDIKLGFDLNVSDGTDTTITSFILTVSDNTPVTLVMDRDIDFTSMPLAGNVKILNTNGFHATLDVPQLYQLSQAPNEGAYDIVDSYTNLRIAGNIRSGNAPSRITNAANIRAVIASNGSDDDISSHVFGYDKRLVFTTHRDLGYTGMHWGRVPESHKGWVLYGGYTNLDGQYSSAYAANDIMMFKLEHDTPVVWRIASTFSDYHGEYRDEAPVALNYAGDRIYWSSDWAGTLDHREIFRCDLPSNWSGELESESIPGSYVMGKARFIEAPGLAPEPGESRIDSNTGLTVKRITNSDIFHDTDDAFMQYSRYSPENTGRNMLLSCGGNSYNSWIINNDTGEIIRELKHTDGKQIGENNEVRWDSSGKHDNRVYYVHGTGFYMIEDVRLNSTGVLIKDFAPIVPGMTRLYNDVEGDSSLDSDHWTWMASWYDQEGDKKYHVLAFVHYQVSTDTYHLLKPSDLAGSNLEALKTDPSFTKPNMVEMAPDGSRIVLHFGRKYGPKEESLALINTYFDGAHAWPVDFDWKKTPPLKVSISETHSCWSPNKAGEWCYISQNSSDDGMDAIVLGEQALSEKVDELDLNGRAVTMTEAQHAAVSIILNGGAVNIV